MNEHRVLIYLAWATLITTLFIAVLLIVRGGRSPETAAILKAIEGGRQQASVHQDTVEAELRDIRRRLREVLVRFGFLKPPL